MSTFFSNANGNFRGGLPRSRIYHEKIKKIKEITAIEVRYDALRYTGGSAQQEAAAAHEKPKYKMNGETKVHISSERLRLQPLSSQDFRESGSPYWPV